DATQWWISCCSPPITGTFMPPKPNLVFHNAPITVETNHSAFTVKLSSSEPTQDLSHTNRPSAPIIEEWVSDSEDESETTAPQIAPSFVQTSEGHTKQNASFPQKHLQKHMAPTTVLTQSKPVFNIAVRPFSAVVPNIMITRPRYAHSIDTKSKLTFRRHLTRSQSPKTSNSPPKVTTAKAPVVSAAQDYELAARLRAEEQR
nr:hypothetical protein [Tanacetum cinerariifolium]